MFTLGHLKHIKKQGVGSAVDFKGSALMTFCLLMIDRWTIVRLMEDIYTVNKFILIILKEFLYNKEKQ